MIGENSMMIGNITPLLPFCWAWGFQFFGHYIEGKQPALTESVTQSLYTRTSICS